MSEYEERFKKWRGKSPVPKPSSEHTLYTNTCKDCGCTVRVSDERCETCITINEALNNQRSDEEC